MKFAFCNQFCASFRHYPEKWSYRWTQQNETASCSNSQAGHNERRSEQYETDLNFIMIHHSVYGIMIQFLDNSSHTS